MNLDINADLGEGEPAARTRALMRTITSANIACGGHAGSARTMDACVKLAIEHDVRIGAHPGFVSPADFGRAARTVDGDVLATLLLQQVGGLEAVARAHGAALHHVKLHGALYHTVESRTALAREFLALVRRYWPGVRVYAMAGGAVCRVAEAAGVETWGEAFAERGYLDSGKLVPRGDRRALLTDPAMVAERVRRLGMYGEILSVNGKPLRVEARTVCVHSDTPNAVRIGRVLREKLREDRGRSVAALPHLA
jgi:UPF0271 protein